MSRRLAVLAGLVLGAILLPLDDASAQATKPAAATNNASGFSPSHLALAREVILNSGITRSFDAIIPAFGEQIKKNSVTRPELTKDLDETLKSLESEMQLQKNRMVEIAAKLYAQRFSEAELKELVAFFRSPTGKRYVQTQPQILDEMVGAMQSWTEEVSEYIMVRVRAEMGKRGHQLQ